MEVVCFLPWISGGHFVCAVSVLLNVLVLVERKQSVSVVKVEVSKEMRLLLPLKMNAGKVARGCGPPLENKQENNY